MLLLQSERLKLRPFNHDDLAIYASWLADERAMRCIGDGRTKSLEEARSSLMLIIDHYRTRGYGPLAVEEKNSGELLGRVGIFYPETWPGIEITWLLAPSYWGYGYATEAAATCMEWAFEQLKIPHLISLIRSDNNASMNVARRIGMKKEKEMLFLGAPTIVYGKSNY